MILQSTRIRCIIAYGTFRVSVELPLKQANELINQKTNFIILNTALLLVQVQESSDFFFFLTTNYFY